MTVEHWLRKNGPLKKPNKMFLVTLLVFLELNLTRTRIMYVCLVVTFRKKYIFCTIFKTYVIGKIKHITANPILWIFFSRIFIILEICICEQFPHCNSFTLSRSYPDPRYRFNIWSGNVKLFNSCFTHFPSCPIWPKCTR